MIIDNHSIFDEKSIEINFDYRKEIILIKQKTILKRFLIIKKKFINKTKNNIKKSLKFEKNRKSEKNRIFFSKTRVFVNAL